MKHIILSPHFNDATFSIGGYIHKLTELGIETEVWTIFSGNNPPNEYLTSIAKEIQARWGYNEQKTRKRIEENKNALSILNTRGDYFHFLDAIYRKDVFGKNIIKGEPDFIKEFDLSIHLKTTSEIQLFIEEKIGQIKENISIYLPLAMGNHPDHKILRIATDNLFSNQKNKKINIYYYADFPYTIRVNDNGNCYAPLNSKNMMIDLNEKKIQNG